MSDRIRVAFLGCGGFMGAHAWRMSHRSDVQIVALCDTTETIAAAFLEKHLKDYKPRPALFHRAAKMYKDAKPDAVVIATPHTLHFEHAMEALDHGLHVLVEKPMVTSASQAHQLAAKAKSAARHLCIGYNTPCFPEFRYLRQNIRAATWGRLQTVSGFVAQDWMKWTTGSWRQDPVLAGGGMAYDSGADVFNSLCWSVESPASKVYARIDNLGTPVDINSIVAVTFENGVMATITICGNSPGNRGYMAFMFEHAHVELDPAGWGSPWISIYGTGGKRVKYPAIAPGPGAGDEPSPDDNFIEAILGRAEPATAPINGIVQSELMDAIYESAKHGKPVKVKR